MNPRVSAKDAITRRLFLGRFGLGLGAMALTGLERSPDTRLFDGASGPHFAPRAKSVIYLHMAGSPPQQDLFDYKPKLNQLHDTPCPDEFIRGKRLAFIKGHPKLLGAPHPFHQCRATGRWMSSLLPHFAMVEERVTMIHSMVTDEFNHAPAQLLLVTGSPRFGAASLGSWVSFGLGSVNQNLPAFVVMVSGGTDPSGGKSLWGSGFLPPVHQATQLRGRGDPILYLANPPGLDVPLRRRSLEALRALNASREGASLDVDLQSRIEQYELAFRMQMSVPDVMDITREPETVRDLYGADPNTPSFANHCLLARRLVERGVRFVQLYDWGWDIHGTGKHDDLMTQFPKKCRDVDRPIAALLVDLARRGLLDETLVVFGGEFGRTAMNERRNGSTYLGRDHHPSCFTMWMAGAGLRPGLTHGETDELGYNVHRDPVHVRDLQATILHLLGLDAERLSFPYQGLRQRLIGPADGPRVVQELLA